MEPGRGPPGFEFPPGSGASPFHHVCRNACTAARSSTDNLTTSPALSRHSLQVRQPRRRCPRLSTSISGCPHPLHFISAQGPLTADGELSFATTIETPVADRRLGWQPIAEASCHCSPQSPARASASLRSFRAPETVKLFNPSRPHLLGEVQPARSGADSVLMISSLPPRFTRMSDPLISSTLPTLFSLLHFPKTRAIMWKVYCSPTMNI